MRRILRRLLPLNNGRPPSNPLFGVNLSGPEFAPWNGQTFPTAAEWAPLRAAGSGIKRLPVAWESLQPTLGAALDATYLGSITTALSRAAALGIGVIVDIHNFGAYADQTRWTHVSGSVGYAGNAGVPATGVSFLGNGVTAANYNDLATRLATALKGRAGLIGVGIMNEPNIDNIVGVNKLKTPNYFTNTIGTYPWVNNGNGATITKLAAGTNPLGANYGPAFKMSGGTYGGVSQAITVATGNKTSSIYAWTDSGTTKLAYGLTGHGGTAQVTTTPTRFNSQYDPSAGTTTWDITQFGDDFLGVGVDINFCNAQYEDGASVSTYEPNPFNTFAQGFIDAYRAVDTTTPLYICGLTNASQWDRSSYEYTLLTGTNLVFEAHQYFDGDQGIGGGGQYSGSYASYSITSAQGSDTIAPYLAWLSAKSKTGYLGEFGIPGGDANWAAVQASCLASLRAASVKGTGWFYGSNGVQPLPGNPLNMPINDARLLQILAA